MSTKLEQKLNLILKEKETKILPENIKKDVKILGVVGTLESDKPDQTKTVTPTTEEQVITPDAGYELASVTVGAVTSDIDNNIQAGNIKKDINILGVTGTLESGGSTNYNAKIENYNGKQIYSALTEIPLLDTSSVIDTSYMFYNCSSLTSIPLLNTTNVTNMEFMFYNCLGLTSIPLLDTSNATNMSYMFTYCSNLQTIPLLNTTNVTKMSCMFRNCENFINMPQLDTSNVTNMNYMFDYCSGLTEVPQLDTSSATDMSYIFRGCSNLQTIPLLNTSNATNMNYMFYRCSSLSDESLNNILTMCINATKITSNKTLKYIGLTSEQATKCTTLSNYSAFTAAGWTTGY